MRVTDLGLAAALAAAACASAEAPAPRVHHVAIRGMTFDPATLELRLGDTVEWTNADVVPHTATAAAFESRLIAPAARWRHTPAARGDVTYTCTLHPTMSGVLRIR